MRDPTHDSNDLKPGRSVANPHLIDLPPTGPRVGKFADHPGKYRLMHRLNSEQVDPGEVVEIEIYVSGYGQIETSKLVFLVSPKLIDQNSSYIRYSIGAGVKGIGFGTSTDVINEFGNVLHMDGGVGLPEWPRVSMYVDSSDDELPRIITETKLRFAPVELVLFTRPTARAGQHSVQICFTYFNGETWESDTTDIIFFIRSFVQRKELFVWVLASCAAVGAVVSAISDICGWISRSP